MSIVIALSDSISIASVYNQPFHIHCLLVLHIIQSNQISSLEFFALSSLGSSVHWRKAFMELHVSARCPSVSDPQYE